MHSNNQACICHLILRNILAAVECCICREKKTVGGCGYETFIKYAREPAPQRLKDCCMEKQHLPLLFADVVGKVIKHIMSYELHYHRSYYREYTKKQRPITEFESTNQFIFNYVRERLIECNDSLDAYNNSRPLKVESVTDVRPILEKMLKEFENTSLYKPTHGKQLL